MKTNSHTVQVLQDIEPPLSPPASSLPTVIFMLTLTLLLVTLTTLAIRHFNSRRSQAMRKLRRLRRLNRCVEEHESTSTLDRNTAFQLASTIAPGLGLNGLTTTTPLPAELSQHQARWQTFKNTLSQSRFAVQAGPASNKNKMFDDAVFWLKKWP